MKKLSALLFSSLFFILFLAFPKSAFAGMSCDSPSGGTYTVGNTIYFTVSASGLNAIPKSGTLTLTVNFNDGGYIGGSSYHVDAPVSDSAGDTISYYASSAATHSGWAATLTYNSDDGTLTGYSYSCINGGAITINLPPPDLGANVSFSCSNPCAIITAQNNPVTFSGSITDSDPNPGTRTVEMFVDGISTGTFTYSNNNGYSGSGSYTVSSGSNPHSWWMKVSMGSSVTYSSAWDFNMAVLSTPTPSPTPTSTPINLPANVHFSNMQPTGNVNLASNNITFQATITDTEPTPGGRTVDVWLDGETLMWEGAYSNNAGLSGSIPYSVTPGTANHFWSITVYMFGTGQTTVQSGKNYFNIPVFLSAPQNLDMKCTEGTTDSSGLPWCNVNDGITLSGTFYTQNAGQSGTANFTIAGTQTAPFSTTTSNAANVSTTLSSASDNKYTWQSWSSGGSWQSSSSTKDIGIDNTAPSGPSGTYFSISGAPGYYINWTLGADSLSGIWKSLVYTRDVTGGYDCNGGQPDVIYAPQTYSLLSCPQSPQNPPQMGNHWLPLDTHTYEALVYNCDYANNCNSTPSVGYYDGTVTSTYSISGTVFNDLNGNRWQDGSETGYDNNMGAATIDLTTSGGSPVGTTYTDSFGNFSFSNLNAGNYTVQLTGIPPTFTATTPVNVSLNLNSDGWATFGINTSSPPSTPTPPPANGPRINSFRMYNYSTPLAPYSGGPAFSGTYGLSGKNDSDQGLKWLNPARVKINAQLGATAPGGTYFTEIIVAFYEKSLYQSTTLPTTMDAIITKLNQSENREKGFVIRASSPFSPVFSIRDNASTTWKTLSTTSVTVIPSTTNPLFGAFIIPNSGSYKNANFFPSLGSVFVEWVVSFGKNSGSKNYYTAVQVKDSQFSVPATFINNYTGITQ